jgi:acyl-CoA synthetase (AMP-forming)/AMP-acid ligase II
MVRILNEEGREIREPWVPGEIVARLNAPMEGYWRRPEDTRETLKDGWLHTGDMGMMDEEGYLYIVDRKKDMIISGARNIYPREIEEVLHSHPSVLEAAVIGVPDEYWGESVKAIVALRPGRPATEEELIGKDRKERVEAVIRESANRVGSPGRGEPGEQEANIPEQGRLRNIIQPGKEGFPW